MPNTSQRILVADEPVLEFTLTSNKLLLGLTYEDAAGVEVAGGSRTVRLRFRAGRTAEAEPPNSGVVKISDVTKLVGHDEDLSVAAVQWEEFDTAASVRVLLAQPLTAGATDPGGATHYRLTVLGASEVA